MSTIFNPTTPNPPASNGLLKYAELILLFVLACTYLYVRSNFFSIPMERDEGIYAYFGHLILDGKIPYLDFYESRLPGIFYMYAFLVAIFGDFEGLALGITLLNIGSLLFLYYFAKAFFAQNQTVAFITIISAAILGLAPEISGYTRQSEHIVVFWATGGLFFLQKAFEKDNWKYLLSAGIFMCLAMLTKPNGVFLILLGGGWTVAHYLFDTEKQALVEGKWGAIIQKTILKGLIYSAGVFGTFGLLCIYLAMKGALDDMWYWAVTYSAAYASRIDFAQGKEFFYMNFANIRANYLSFWGLAGLGLLMFNFLPKINLGQKLGLWLIAIFSFLTIVPSFSFYGHYWIMLMPALALLVGAAFFALQTFVPDRMISSILLAGIFGAAVFLHFTNKNMQGYYTKPNHYKITRRTYGANPFPEAYDIGVKFLKPMVKPGDQIALIGSEPQLYVYTGMRSASKHAYFSYLMNDTAKTKALDWQNEFYEEIKTNKPRFIVFFNHQISILAAPNHSVDVLNKILGEYVPQNYKKIGVVDMVGESQPIYVLEEAKANAYQFIGTRNNQMVPNISIFERK
jgi:hypothetical protein